MFLTFGPPIPFGFLRKGPSGAWQREEVCGTTPGAAQGRGGVECAVCKDRGSPVGAISGGELIHQAPEEKNGKRKLAQGSVAQKLNTNPFLQLSRAYYPFPTPFTWEFEF